MKDQESLSVVVPVYNEVDNLPQLYEAVTGQLDRIGLPYELIFVNDGSHDPSLEVLRQLSARNPRVKVVSLSRNFGHQSAISAGMDHAAGDAVIVMDADLQHPPELIPEMVARCAPGISGGIHRSRGRPGAWPVQAVDVGRLLQVHQCRVRGVDRCRRGRFPADGSRGGRLPGVDAGAVAISAGHDQLGGIPANRVAVRGPTAACGQVKVLVSQDAKPGGERA